jgi:hypothetical protein
VQGKVYLVMPAQVNSGNRIWQLGLTVSHAFLVALIITYHDLADAEDDADNWWVEWGALEERAQETPRALAFDFSAVIATVDIQANVS